MSKLDCLVGQNVRLLRRAKHMTLDEMASYIGKSKATVGKYEQGSIAMDIDTLFDVAKALSVKPSTLLTDLAADTRAERKGGSALEQSGRRYLYYYDGRTGHIVKSLLVFDSEEEPLVTMFYNLDSFLEPQRSRALYCGRMQRHELITNYLLQNQTNGIEHVFICTLKPLGSSGVEDGLLSGLSSRTLLPVSAKCALCDHVLAEDDALKERLTLTREDLRLTRKFNMFTVEHMDE